MPSLKLIRNCMNFPCLHATASSQRVPQSGGTLQRLTIKVIWSWKHFYIILLLRSQCYYSINCCFVTIAEILIHKIDKASKTWTASWIEKLSIACTTKQKQHNNQVKKINGSMQMLQLYHKCHIYLHTARLGIFTEFCRVHFWVLFNSSVNFLSLYFLLSRSERRLKNIIHTMNSYLLSQE